MTAYLKSVLFRIPFLCLLVVTNTNHLFAQTNDYSDSDSIKTVALSISKKWAYEKFPVDTLVKVLNLNSTDPKIVYYKSTEDHSKKGHYSDYYVSLKLKSDSQFDTKEYTYTKVIARDRTPNKQPDGSDYYKTTQDITVGGTSIPAKAVIEIKIKEKSKNEKITRQILQAKGPDEQAAQSSAIMLLINYLQNICK